MSCVSQSMNNCLETILNFKLGNGEIDRDRIDFLAEGGYFLDGQVNFSDRFLAKVSGTSRDGNSGPKVVLSARQFGLVPESDWPWHPGVETWEDYYSEIPQAVLDKGRRFRELFGLPFEMVYGEENLRSCLTSFPVQAYVRYGGQFVDGIRRHVDGEPNHAVELISTYGCCDMIFDTYAPDPLGPESGLYRAALDYGMPYGMAVDVVPTIQAETNHPMIDLPDNSLVIVVDGLGERLMWAAGRLYADDSGKILLEVEARNAKDGKSAIFPIVHVRSSDLAGVPRFNLKGELVR